MEVRVLQFGSPDQQASVMLRDKILRQPLGLSFTAAELDAEGDQVHIGAFENGMACGVLLLKPLSTQLIKMRQVAVDNTMQSRGIGKQMVVFAEQWCIANGYQTIELNARMTAVPFYLSQDYMVEGNLFEEVGIPHLKMLKHLTRSPRE